MSNYLDPRFTLQEQLSHVFNELQIPSAENETVVAFLEPLRLKNLITYEHYEHSVRVSLIAKKIAQALNLDQKALFYAGLLHDIGKCQTCSATLGKTEGWTEADTEAIKSHVMDAYRFLRGRFDFSAEVIALHHQFQTNGYPFELPAHLHDYSEKTKALIKLYARLLALADVYDALHRVNDKFGTKSALSGDAIKSKMLELNPDLRQSVLGFYNIGIFTTITAP